MSVESHLSREARRHYRLAAEHKAGAEQHEADAVRLRDLEKRALHRAQELEQAALASGSRFGR